MYVDSSSIVWFVLGTFYLIMLPGYLIIVSLRIRSLDIIETLTMSFGIGVGVLTAISTGLSLAGSIGLTLSSLTASNTTFLVALCVTLYLRDRRERRKTDSAQYKAVEA